MAETTLRYGRQPLDERKVTCGQTELRILLPEYGDGPAVVLIADPRWPIEVAEMRQQLFAEEGYVAALATDAEAEVVGALERMPETSGAIGLVAHGEGCRSGLTLAADPRISAVGLFDPPADLSDAIAGLPATTSLVVQCASDTALNTFRPVVAARIDAWLHGYADAPVDFAIKGTDSYLPRLAAIAHSRLLDVMRRRLGPHYDFAALFAEHMRHEFETCDVDATMATMVDEPYVNHVPTLSGGVGHDMLKRFYKYHFIGQNSQERSMTPVSYTVGGNRLVLEQVLKFRHDAVLDRYFPNIEPTDEVVEIPIVIFVTFRGSRVVHEHLYWDQGSALKQIGVLDAGGLPIAGPEAAHKLLDETEPSNIFMTDRWATSENKPI